MSTHALIVIPPFLKYISGPLLGPSMLASAAREREHEATVLDLNLRWIREHLPAVEPTPSAFVGDHDRPSEILRALQRDFGKEMAPAKIRRASSSPGLPSDPASAAGPSRASCTSA